MQQSPATTALFSKGKHFLFYFKKNASIEKVEGSKKLLQKNYSIKQQFCQAMLNTGILYKGRIIADGTLHYGYIDGDPLGSKNLAYVLIDSELGPVVN
jgi:hypothetical protein